MVSTGTQPPLHELIDWSGMGSWGHPICSGCSELLMVFGVLLGFGNLADKWNVAWPGPWCFLTFLLLLQDRVSSQRPEVVVQAPYLGGSGAGLSASRARMGARWVGGPGGLTLGRWWVMVVGPWQVGGFPGHKCHLS